MKEYIPDYYKDFQCIADKCKDSCCIGWEIMIDRMADRPFNTTGRCFTFLCNLRV